MSVIAKRGVSQLRAGSKLRGVRLRLRPSLHRQVRLRPDRPTAQTLHAPALGDERIHALRHTGARRGVRVAIHRVATMHAATKESKEPDAVAVKLVTRRDRAPRESRAARPTRVMRRAAATTFSGPTPWVRFSIAIANTFYVYDLGSSFEASGSMQLGQPQATSNACGSPGTSAPVQVGIFNYPASFDSSANVSSVQPVPFTATFTDPATGSVAAVATTIVAWVNRGVAPLAHHRGAAPARRRGSHRATRCCSRAAQKGTLWPDRDRLNQRPTPTRPHATGDSTAFAKGRARRRR